MNTDASPTPPAMTQTFTRCPGCATVFRVSAAQLALREGQVRCGHCRAVFDANDHRVALDASRPDDDYHDELAAGRPTVTLRSAEALQPVAAKPVAHDAADTHDGDAQRDASTAPASGAAAVPAIAGHTPTVPAITGDAPIVPATAGDPASIAATTGESASIAATTGETVNVSAIAGMQASQPAPAIDAAKAPIAIEDAGPRPPRGEWKPRRSLRERPALLYAGAVVLLLGALGAQALFEYRDALAAHAPFTRPILAALCAPIGCSVSPLRDAGALSIDASDLRADPAHRGLLELSATIRNRAPYPIAWPYLELTLTDPSDHVVARRAFEPGDYAAADIRQGIAGNGEQVVTLVLDASATLQAGYRLYLFYP
jgi:predicted Zn finger-like uncharacterized protein